MKGIYIYVYIGYLYRKTGLKHFEDEYWYNCISGVVTVMRHV